MARLYGSHHCRFSRTYDFRHCSEKRRPEWTDTVREHVQKYAPVRIDEGIKGWGAPSSGVGLAQRGVGPKFAGIVRLDMRWFCGGLKRGKS